MARLYRPHIPLSVRVLVAHGQISRKGEIPPARDVGESLASLLDRHLKALARLRGCAVEDLRLDHDPPLGARPQERRGLSRKVFYVPDANDPEHLFYRPHGAQFEGSHDVKTRIRGDHGQFSDVTLIKRERRRQRREADAKNPKKKRLVWRSSPLAGPKKTRWPKRKFGSKKSPRRK